MKVAARMIVFALALAGSTGPVTAQTVRLVHTNSVDDLPPVLGYHMEQVIDHLGLRAMHAHLQIVGGVHIHDGCT